MVNYRQNGIDLPVMESLATLPYITDTRQVSDKQYTNMISDGKRYIYIFFDTSVSTIQLWRYDTFTDSFMRLVPTSSTFSPSGQALYGTGFPMALAYCRTRDRIYMYNSNSGNSYIGELDLRTMNIRNMSNAPITSGADIDMTHTCSGIDSSSNDNLLYITKSNRNTLYTYDVSSFTPATLSSNTAETISGGKNRIFWLPGWDADKIVTMYGSPSNATYSQNIVVYSISGGTSFGGATEERMDVSQALQLTLADGRYHYAYSNERNELFCMVANGEELGTATWRERTIMKATFYKGVIQGDTATGGTTTTVVNSSADYAEDAYTGKILHVLSGTGAGQTARIKSNTSTTFTLYSSFSTPTSSDSVFEVTDNILDWGTATSGTSTTLTDSGKLTWTASFLVGKRISIVSGTGSGQERVISANTTTAVTVGTAWSVTPDNTSKYVIRATKFINSGWLPLNDSWSTTYGLYSRNITTMRIKGIDYVYVIPGGSRGEWFRYQVIDN